MGKQIEAPPGEEGRVDLVGLNKLLQLQGLVFGRAQPVQFRGLDQHILPGRILVATDNRGSVQFAVDGTVLFVSDTLPGRDRRRVPSLVSASLSNGILLVLATTRKCDHSAVFRPRCPVVGVVERASRDRFVMTSRALGRWGRHNSRPRQPLRRVPLPLLGEVVRNIAE